jgi:hypothetical protein
MELLVNQKLEDIVVLIQHRITTLGTPLILEAVLVAVKIVFKSGMLYTQEWLVRQSTITAIFIISRHKSKSCAHNITERREEERNK